MRRSTPARRGRAIVARSHVTRRAPRNQSRRGTVDGGASFSVQVRPGWTRACRRPSAAPARGVREMRRGGPPRPHPAAIPVPHAAYEYSGRPAAGGFAAAGTGWRRALVLAPSHFAAFHGAAVLPMTAYRTPLGLVSID